MNTLDDLGWNPFFEAHCADIETESLVPARVAAEHRERYDIWAAAGVLTARTSGRFRYVELETGERPAVGDWVAVEARPDEGSAIIHRLLPRRTSLVRKEAGVRTSGQVLAANVDTVFLVTSLNQEFNPRRTERFLSLIYEGGAEPVIVLNKADLCADVAEWESRARSVAGPVSVHALSALKGDGLDAIGAYCRPGRTIALIGSSGVGKTTLTNRLTGSDALKVREIREDDARGRHTTSSRQLVRLPEGGLLIDTPGLREVGLWEASEGVGETFADLEDLAAGCRFSDCRHESEPGCAVQAALDEGTLDPGRYRSYLKLRRELAFIDRRQDQWARLAEKKRWKSIARRARQLKRP